MTWRDVYMQDPGGAVLLLSFVDNGEKEKVARSLHEALKNVGVNSFMVSTAGAGDRFGPQTVEGLIDMYALVAIYFNDYGEQTSSSYIFLRTRICNAV